MRILISGFKGNANSAKVLLDNLSSELEKLYLDNEKLNSIKQLSPYINKYDLIFIFGQKPLMKDKISIELCGRINNEIVETNYPIDDLLDYFKEKYCTKLSQNAGTSYCNNIYFNMLNKSPKAKILFIHIPFLKNISVFDYLANCFNKYFLNLLHNK